MVVITCAISAFKSAVQQSVYTSTQDTVIIVEMYRSAVHQYIEMHQVCQFNLIAASHCNVQSIYPPSVAV